MISFDNVTKRYADGHVALNNVSFNLKRGEMVFLTGHSGAGKSTLLKLIALVERSSTGQIWFDGQDLNQLSKRQIPHVRRSIGMIFQNPSLLNQQTVFDNVALPLVVQGAKTTEINRRVRASLEKVGLLKKEKSYPPALSVGEQQRVGIARAIVHKPTLLLADEPTGNLDPLLAAEIMHLFGQFNRVGVSILIASHDLALIAKLKHRMITLQDGHLISDATGVTSE